MKLGSWHRSRIHLLRRTSKLSLMNLQALFGKSIRSLELRSTLIPSTNFDFALFSIVMEFANDGDVFQRICEHQNKKQFWKENRIWKILIQIVRGLQALHELSILHRDMKSANIFLYKDQTAKLGDLNVSKVAKNGLCQT